GGNIVSVEQCAPELTSRYGIVGIGDPADGGHDSAFKINEMVEKPQPDVAPSNLFINGRYILQPEVFDILSRQEAGAGGEIQITDAMVELMETQSFYAHEFHGQTFDCGSKVGFLAANVAFALDRPDIEADFREAIELILEL
ncbi:MAG: UTP--glucose-1-phosphate uridylyltransferase, partial [Rhizobiales bacterium]|nr:UTP--glucose-1-phosphate uridylyltransferase [Hyphomicrobiales bacterium]